MAEALSNRTIEIVKATVPALEKGGTAVTDRMYQRLFRTPEIRDLFNQSHHGETGSQSKALTAPGGWNGWRDFTVESVTPESDIIRSFILVPADGRGVIRHRPGQYLTFALDVPGAGVLKRNYSISSAPDSRSYRISVKREFCRLFIATRFVFAGAKDMPRDPRRFAFLRKHNLVSFLLTHLAIGVVAGVVVCLGLLALDVASLRTLLLGSEYWLIGFILLFGSVCGTFGGVAMAVAVMNLGDWSDHPDRDY